MVNIEEELKTRLPKRSDGRFFTPLLTALEKDGLLLPDREIVRLAGLAARPAQGDGRERDRQPQDSPRPAEPIRPRGQRSVGPVAGSRSGVVHSGRLAADRTTPATTFTSKSVSTGLQT